MNIIFLRTPYLFSKLNDFLMIHTFRAEFCFKLERFKMKLKSKIFYYIYFLFIDSQFANSFIADSTKVSVNIFAEKNLSADLDKRYIKKFRLLENCSGSPNLSTCKKRSTFTNRNFVDKLKSRGIVSKRVQVPNSGAMY